MSSNLKVNNILPSTGANIGLGTASGTLNVDGGCKVQVGTALTLGHTQGVQFHTQNLHSTGFEINQINASGIVTSSTQINVGSNIKLGSAGVATATSFVGSGANLTSLPAANLTGALPAISGANLTNLPPSAPVGGASTNSVFFENDKAVAVNYQVTSTKNAMSAGPIAINAGIAVTVPSGCAWTIV